MSLDHFDLAGSEDQDFYPDGRDLHGSQKLEQALLAGQNRPR
jgi:hypothetical protein